MPSIELRTIEYTKAELSKVPAADRVFFFTITGLVNDLLTLHKQIGVAISEVPENKIINQGNSTVGLLNMRMMAGRMWEGWIAVSKFGRQLRSDYEPHFSPQASIAISHIRSYFPQPDNLINRLRNKIGFHADPELIDRAFKSLPDDAEMGDYLSRTIGHTLFYSCEMLHYQALCEITGIENSVSALHTVVEELWRTTNLINSFVYGFVNSFYLKYLPDKLDAMKQNPPERLERGVPNFDEMRFSYFSHMPMPAG